MTTTSLRWPLPSATSRPSAALCPQQSSQRCVQLSLHCAGARRLVKNGVQQRSWQERHAGPGKSACPTGSSLGVSGLWHAGVVRWILCCRAMLVHARLHRLQNSRVQLANSGLPTAAASLLGAVQVLRGHPELASCVGRERAAALQQPQAGAAKAALQAAFTALMTCLPEQVRALLSLPSSRMLGWTGRMLP